MPLISLAKLGAASNVKAQGCSATGLVSSCPHVGQDKRDKTNKKREGSDLNVAVEVFMKRNVRKEQATTVHEGCWGCTK
jgi:hypothetical protein